MGYLVSEFNALYLIDLLTTANDFFYNFFYLTLSLLAFSFTPSRLRLLDCFGSVCALGLLLIQSGLASIT